MKYKLFLAITHKIFYAIGSNKLTSSRIRIFFLRKTGIIFGKDVHINDGIIILKRWGYKRTQIVIEDRVAISSNVSFICETTHHHSKLKTIFPEFRVLDGKIHICEDTVIGTGAIIMPNVTIGKMSVIGAGSVITKDVGPYSVVVGVPGKVIKKISDEKK